MTEPPQELWIVFLTRRDGLQMALSPCAHEWEARAVLDDNWDRTRQTEAPGFVRRYVLA